MEGAPLVPYLHPDDVLARAVAWAECGADPQAEPLGDAWETAGAGVGRRLGRRLGRGVAGAGAGPAAGGGRAGPGRLRAAEPGGAAAYPVIAITDLAEAADATIGERSEGAASGACGDGDDPVALSLQDAGERAWPGSRRWRRTGPAWTGGSWTRTRGCTWCSASSSRFASPGFASPGRRARGRDQRARAGAGRGDRRDRGPARRGPPAGCGSGTGQRLRAGLRSRLAAGTVSLPDGSRPGPRADPGPADPGVSRPSQDPAASSPAPRARAGPPRPARAADRGRDGRGSSCAAGAEQVVAITGPGRAAGPGDAPGGRPPRPGPAARRPGRRGAAAARLRPLPARATTAATAEARETRNSGDAANSGDRTWTTRRMRRVPGDAAAAGVRVRADRAAGQRVDHGPVRGGHRRLRRGLRAARARLGHRRPRPRHHHRPRLAVALARGGPADRAGAAAGRRPVPAHPRDDRAGPGPGRALPRPHCQVPARRCAWTTTCPTRTGRPRWPTSGRCTDGTTTSRPPACGPAPPDTDGGRGRAPAAACGGAPLTGHNSLTYPKCWTEALHDPTHPQHTPPPAEPPNRPGRSAAPTTTTALARTLRLGQPTALQTRDRPSQHRREAKADIGWTC